jgi:putative membrane protein
MRRQQFIKPAHIWILTVLVACGLWVVAGKAGITIQGQQNSNQNQNQNGNTNGNQNANTGQNRNANTNTNTGETRNANTNANTGENRNANTTGNRNTGATGEQAGMGNMSSRDRDFVMDAAMSSMLEVELGRIAAQQGASDSVKQFGQMMVDHHQKANAELMTLASSKGVTLPTTLDEKHQQQLTKLQGLSGAEFDRAYARLMVREHRDAVSDFEKENSRGTDMDLKAFAGKTLPTLQEHLRMARALEDEHGGGNNRNNNSNTGGNRNNNGNNNNNSNRP